jgi:hypothetical protein
MWHPTNINSDDTMNGYEKAAPHRAVKNVKDVLTAYQYHQIAEINSFLVAQSNRVANMLDAMETYLAGITVSTSKGNLLPYQNKQLGARWRAFMNSKAQTAKGRAETYMDTWVQGLKDGYCSDYQREKANDDDKILIKKIDELSNAVQAKSNWALPNF